MKKVSKNKIEKADQLIALIIVISLVYLIIYILDPDNLIRGIYVLFLVQLLFIYYYFRYNLVYRTFVPEKPIKQPKPPKKAEAQKKPKKRKKSKR